MPFRRPDALLPLTPIAFEVLLALADSDQHGYGILQQVEARLRPVMPLRTGTLYRALARLLEDGLIEELVTAPAGSTDDRRRYYRITKLGRRTAEAEAQRLADQVSLARARRLLGARRR